MDLKKPNVKAVSLNKVHHGNPLEEMLKRMPNTDFDKIADVYITSKNLNCYSKYRICYSDEFSSKW